MLLYRMAKRVEEEARLRGFEETVQEDAEPQLAEDMVRFYDTAGTELDWDADSTV